MMTIDEEIKTKIELEKLLINNRNFEKISKFQNRFNPLKVMKMQHMEIRHSSILAWLLAPHETHGFGDIFLKKFLSEALMIPEDFSESNYNEDNINALEILQNDLSDTEVRTEWRNIDIFLANEKHQWLFVIENKFYSKQGKGQLEKYKDIVDKYDAHNEYRKSYIFLTLNDEEPDNDHYVSIKYEDIRDIVCELIEDYETRLNPEVKTFLKHYIEILEEVTNMSNEKNQMVNLAKELYRDHKAAIDFIVQHGANSEFAVACEALIGETKNKFDPFETKNGEKFIFCGMNNSSLNFLPKNWYDKINPNDSQWSGCKGWWAEYPLILWFRLRNTDDAVKGNLKLFAEVGPISNYETRQSLIDKIKHFPKEKQLKIRFSNTAHQEKTKSSRFFTKNNKSISDTQDNEIIFKAMEELLKDFKNEIDWVSLVLDNKPWENLPKD